MSVYRNLGTKVEIDESMKGIIDKIFDRVIERVNKRKRF